MAVFFGTAKQWVVTSTRKDINKSVAFKVQGPLYELASVKVEG